MIVATLLSPISTIYLLGPVAFPMLSVTLGTSLAVYMTSSMESGSNGPGDITCLVLTSFFVLLYSLTMFYMTCWHNFESYFESFPWRIEGDSGEREDRKSFSHALCPYSGKRPTIRCPSCQCLVHHKFFRKHERFSQSMNEIILRWDKAKAALEDTHVQSIEEKRANLDEALDFRGNVYFQSVSGSCIGCATWQKCFNLAPRYSLSLATASVVFSLVPWGFLEFLDILGTGGLVIRIMTGAIAVSFAASALVVQLRALGRAIMFLKKYGKIIPLLQEVKICFTNKNKGLDFVMKHALATSWDPLM